ncbi:MAG TPA: GNAT family N-acetyltransferase [Gaiellaceae bacterium]|jgi:GNAT superfamily N-acetyltransferase
MRSSPPDGVAERPLSRADAEEAARLGRELEAALGLRAATTVDELLDWWSETDLETDSWAFEEAGRLLAFAWFDGRGDVFEGGGVVGPQALGRGLGARIVDLSELRARELGLAFVRNHVYAVDLPARRLLEARGYRDVRHFFEMVVELDESPREPVWPDGIEARPFRREDARALFDALGEAFAEEWGFVARSYEEWYLRRIEGADTSLYFLAWDGRELAGVARCEAERRGMGWVGALGVRPGWRRRGLGRALLLHALGEFHRRGERRVGLGVDAANPTGATALYESVGMVLTVEDVVYERRLA